MGVLVLSTANSGNEIIHVKHFKKYLTERKVLHKRYFLLFVGVYYAER